jgi:hypothetical protein
MVGGIRRGDGCYAGAILIGCGVSNEFGQQGLPPQRTNSLFETVPWVKHNPGDCQSLNYVPAAYRPGRSIEHQKIDLTAN